MKAKTANALLNIGIPAGMKGFTYICDAMDFFASDPYYADGKICVLYYDIARKRAATATSVERAIRHAFEIALTRGNPEQVENYLDPANTQNSHLLKTLFLKLKLNLAEESPASVPAAPSAPAPVSVKACHPESCGMRKQIYHELMSRFSRELEEALAVMESKTPSV